MRKLPSAVLAVALTPAFVALPTVTPPRAEPRPVAPVVESLPVSGVDPKALVALEREGASRPGTDATGAESSAALTPQRSVAPFDLVGVTWTSDGSGQVDAGDVSVRVRIREGGRWSSWHRLPVPDEGPDAGTEEARQSAGRIGTSPLFTENADGVQVRVDTPTGRPPAGLRVDLIDPGESPADAELDAPPPASSAVAAAPQPTILSRAQWGADESLRGGTSYSSTIKAFVVHHTAGSNSYSESTAASQIRGIYAYHTQTLGYSDIAYNFLVDRFGRIYEGRNGSITAPVRGAHAGGFNDFTMGVGAMGNFDVAAAPSVMIDAITRVAAWKLGEYGRDALGTVSLTSAGGGTSKYPKGTVVTKNVLGAHRDFGYTACPGKYIFDQMDSIRSKAASLNKGSTPPPVAPGLVSPSVTATQVPYGSSPGIGVRAGVKTTQAWQLVVAPLCSGTAVRRLSGRATTALSTTWDLKNGSGAFVPPGVYRLLLTSSSETGTATPWSTYVEVVPRAGAPTSTCPTRRLSGPDRYATSVAQGRAAYRTSDVVVLASGEQSALADGLVAGPLARAKAGPVLLVRRDGLPSSVAQDISARRVKTAYIVGATTVVGRAVETELRALGVTTIRRLWGKDRYGTAAAVARAVGDKGGAAVVASGRSLVDAVSAAGPAGRAGRPILLVTPNGVPAPTAAALRDLAVTSATVIGSTAVVPAAVASQLGVKTTRLGGADRYETAVAIAEGFAPVVGTSTVVVASGEEANLADGMAGGTLGRLTVLTRPTALPTVTASWLGDAPRSYAFVLGGPNAVSTTTMRAVHEAATS